MHFRLNISFPRVEIEYLIIIGAHLRRRVWTTLDGVDFLAQALFGKGLRAADLNLGHAGQRFFLYLEGNDQIVLVGQNALPHMHDRVTVSEVLHVRLDGPRIFLKQGAAGKAATVTAEKGDETGRAGLLRFQISLHVGERDLVCSGDAYFGQFQTAVEINVVDDLELMTVELCRVKVLAGFFRAVFDRVRRGRSHGAERNYLGKEIALLLKLVLHAAGAFLQH